mmetsp:Transcript_1469/g.2326  ORF Transcript_1469/g.2326 Transcript_1469/m.2326 type:complete len:323 (+) Transcript_1469:182-1150(+)
MSKSNMSKLRVTIIYLFLCLVGLLALHLCSRLFANGRALEKHDHNRQAQSTNRKLWGFDPKSVSVKPTLVKGTVVGVINTPKSGTGTLTGTFFRSFRCGKHEKSVVDTVQGRNCPAHNHAFRTHRLKEGGIMLRHFVQKYPHEKCMVVTAIRNPQTWLPSLFMEKHKKTLCEGSTIRSAADFVMRYRRWFLKNKKEIRKIASSVVPHLLKEFGGKSLTHQMTKMNENGGYVLMHNKSKRSKFRGCDLLFLRMEDQDNWSNVLPSVIPGTTYSRSQSRADLCPNIANYYQAIQAYQFTDRERRKIMGNDKYMREYFEVYNFLN